MTRSVPAHAFASSGPAEPGTTLGPHRPHDLEQREVTHTQRDTMEPHLTCEKSSGGNLGVKGSQVQILSSRWSRNRITAGQRLAEHLRSSVHSGPSFSHLSRMLVPFFSILGCRDVASRAARTQRSGTWPGLDVANRQVSELPTPRCSRHRTHRVNACNPRSLGALDDLNGTSSAPSSPAAHRRTSPLPRARPTWPGGQRARQLTDREGHRRRPQCPSSGERPPPAAGTGAICRRAGAA